MTKQAPTDAKSSTSNTTDSRGGNRRDKSKRNKKDNNHTNNTTHSFKGHMQTGVLAGSVVTLDGKTTTQCRELIAKLVTYTGDNDMNLWPNAIENLEGVDRSTYFDAPPDDSKYTTTITNKDGSGKDYKQKIVTNASLETQLNNAWSIRHRVQTEIYEKYILNGAALYNIVKNQIDPRMIERMAQDPSYQKIKKEQDIISFLKLLKNACNSNSGGSRKFGPQ